MLLLPPILDSSFFMKKCFFLCALVFCLMGGMFSCSKDFNSNAPYEDVTVVYGILNSSDTVHYIKIYKGFLTDGNAAEAAQVYDSLYYFDRIDAVVEEYVNGQLVATIPLDTTLSIPRDPGDFAAPDQLVYKFSRVLNPDAVYKLRITNKETGRVVTAETKVVGNFSITAPAPSNAGVSIINTTQTPLKFTVSANAYSYDIYQTFYYIERDRTTEVETVKSIRRKINSTALFSPSTSYVPALLVDLIVSEVKPDKNLDRYISVDSCLKFEAWAVNEHLAHYWSSNRISGSIVFDRMQYTNVQCEDGRATGIFGSRSSAEEWYGLNANSQRELVTGDKTMGLNFHYAWEYLDLHQE